MFIGVYIRLFVVGEGFSIGKRGVISFRLVVRGWVLVLLFFFVEF